MPKWTATERLYLNADKTKVIHEGEPGAASLLCGKGTIVDEDVARRWQLGPFAPIPDAGDDVGNALGHVPPDAQSATENPDPPKSGSESDSGNAVKPTPVSPPIPDTATDPSSPSDASLTPRRRK